MASEIILKKVNETFIKIECEQSIAYELRDFFTFTIPNHRYHPLVKNKIWDGKIRLFNLNTRCIYKGLYNKILDFAKKSGYKVILKYKPYNNNINIDDVSNIFKNINGTHKPHSHQVNSLYHCIKYQNVLILSPTASGKSFFIYNLVKFVEPLGKTLIVVPTTNLVEQLYKDFVDYSKKNKWSVEDNCHKIYSGKEKEMDIPVTISTWQSIYKLPESYFSQFNTVLVDEAHTAKANCIKSIMEKSVNAKFRIGCTGSLDDIKTNMWTLEGLFGPITEVITSKELMDDGKIAELKINSILIKHDLNEEILKSDYHKQTEYFITMEKRNKMIQNVVMSQKGNKLVLFRQVQKHGLPLYKSFKINYPDNEIYYISGMTPIDEREKIRERLNHTDNAVLIASDGVYSTGMNVPSLNHVFSTYPGKSKIRLLQSIGRVLRKNKDKESATFWDFGDIMKKGKKTNIGFSHYRERQELYMKQKFNIKFHEVKL